MDCVVTPLKTLMSFFVHLNVQLKFYNLPSIKTSSSIELNLGSLSMLAVIKLVYLILKKIPITVKVISLIKISCKLIRILKKVVILSG